MNPSLTHSVRGPRLAGRPVIDAVEKVCGGDNELGNFIEGRERLGGTGGEAARLLLRQIEGFSRPALQTWTPSSGGYGHDGGSSWGRDEDPHRSPRPAYPEREKQAGDADSGRYQEHAQDSGRKFLPANGGCAYIDLNHLELCLPEVRSAFEHVAAWHAMLRIARSAQVRANRLLDGGERIVVLVNNSDQQSHSFGSHLDLMLTRRCFDDIFDRRLHYLLFLASAQCAAIPLTGAGKTGSENNRPHADYQISSRADFFETLVSVRTTFARPIVNSRREALVGPIDGGEEHRLARLHIIFFDSTLAHVSSLLKIGMMQIIGSMLEQDQVPANLLLDDPLDAVLRWSHDPDLRTRARLLDGRRFTAVEFSQAVFDRASRFVASGRAEDFVPRAGEIINLWGDTLAKLRARDFEALASRLDWVAKRNLLKRAIDKHNLTWTSPQIRYLDQIYSSLDPEEGLYWACERSGQMQRLVSDEEIERFVHEPPEDTRAWLRARLLRTHAPHIDDVDWDRIRFRFEDRSYGNWTTYRYPILVMSHPLRSTRSECEPMLSGSGTPQQALQDLDPQPDAPAGTASAGSVSTAIVPLTQT